MAKAKAKTKTVRRKTDYFGLDRVISLILVIIPFTSLICGIIVRLQEGKIIAALVRFLVGWNIIWILDIIFMVQKRKIFRLLNV